MACRRNTKKTFLHTKPLKETKKLANKILHDLALEKFFGKHSWTQAWAGRWCLLEILKRTLERYQGPVLWTCTIQKQHIILLSYFPRMTTLKDNTKAPSVDHLKLNILGATKTTLPTPKRCKHHHPFYMGVPPV